MLFVRAILFLMGIVVKYPITLHIDNIGDIFLLKNIWLSQQTKHIDMRRHFIHAYIERTVKIQFFCSEENLTAPYTNNLSNGKFEFLTLRYAHRE